MNDIERELDNPRTRARLLSIAKRIMRNPHDAEDVLQDALLLATLNAHQYERRSSPTTWLCQVVVNACRMRLRALRRECRGGHLKHVSLHDLVLDPMGGDTPEELLQVREAVAVVLRELAEVSPKDAALFERAIAEDVPLGALADESDMTTQAVKSRLFRVRRRLAESLSRTGAANLRMSA
jgi:RNA polymerase sigma-70 factor (ECF subfamily)